MNKTLKMKINVNLNAKQNTSAIYCYSRIWTLTVPRSTRSLYSKDFLQNFLLYFVRWRQKEYAFIIFAFILYFLFLNSTFSNCIFILNPLWWYLFLFSLPINKFQYLLHCFHALSPYFIFWRNWPQISLILIGKTW